MSGAFRKAVLPLVAFLILFLFPGCDLDDYRLVKSHPVPEWFRDAKFGVLVHYGPYTVPGWAPLSEPGDFTQMGYFTNNPYAEWYWNTMRIAGSPTWEYHRLNYGEDFSYFAFGPQFESASGGADMEGWAELFEEAGVRYAIITTKHHDGYCLWPTVHPNPAHPEWHSRRDLVEDFCRAMRGHGIRVGLYYSSSYDWAYREMPPITDLFSLLNTILQDPDYVDYCMAQWQELVKTYRPDILWNDIALPGGFDRWKFWADYYRSNPEGVVNDRWSQNPVELAYNLAIAQGVEKIPPLYHFDFFTPEYQVMREARLLKWETCRGIGWSFAYNRLEEEETGHLLTGEELVEILADVVSKNGNLLLGIGPRADGTIPEAQQMALRQLGGWLKVNGQSIYGTRPWREAEGTADGGAVRVRFTARGDEGSGALFAILLDRPSTRKVVISGLRLAKESRIRLLDGNVDLKWRQRGEDIVVILPDRLPQAPAYVLAISPLPP